MDARSRQDSINLVSPVRYRFFLYRYLDVLYHNNTTVRRIRRLAMYCTEDYTQLVIYQVQSTGRKVPVTHTSHTKQFPYAQCTQLPWFRFPFNFPALPWNFSARRVKWIELVDPGPRSNKLHSKRKNTSSLRPIC